MDDDDDDSDCPLCMEEIDATDKYFKPCPCGYRVCRFCWNHITQNLNSLCPACRRPYSDLSVEFKPVPQEELLKSKNVKKRKETERKLVQMEQRKQLSNVRVLQKNLVYVLSLPPKLISEDTLRSNEFFGQYGKITKVVINRRNPTIQQPTANTGVYITYTRKDEAARAIEAVDGSICDGRVIRATFGTTKYCSYYLKSQVCQNLGCQFLHEAGEEADPPFGHHDIVQNHSIKDLRQNSQPVLRERKEFPQAAVNMDEGSVLPATASWAKSNHPIIAQPKQFPVQQNHFAEDSSGTKIEEIKTIAEEIIADVIEVAQQKESPLQILERYIQRANVTPRDVGYTFSIAYNGLFDPFRDDSLTRNIVASRINMRAAAVGRGNDGNVGLSRFERLFDDREGATEEGTNMAGDLLKQPPRAEFQKQINRLKLYAS